MINGSESTDSLTSLCATLEENSRAISPKCVKPMVSHSCRQTPGRLGKTDVRNVQAECHGVQVKHSAVFQIDPRLLRSCPARHPASLRASTRSHPGIKPRATCKQILVPPDSIRNRSEINPRTTCKQISGPNKSIHTQRAINPQTTRRRYVWVFATHRE